MKVKLSDPILKPLSDEQMHSLSKRDLLIVLKHEQRLRQFYEDCARLMEEKIFEVAGQLYRVKASLYGPSSEKSPRQLPDRDKKPKDKAARTGKLPSERYPNAEIMDEDITCLELPSCRCCGETMQDSGMVETTEYLTVIPKKYIVVRQHRHKYRCGQCHGDIQTTPAAPRVVPGSSYSDEMIVDATLSKYCDLIPMERYCQMAGRLGFPGLPPQSMIEASFKLAHFFKGVYDRLRQETLNTSVLLADETPHKMLEGDPKKRWFLWGFLSNESCFYECHDTRSGDVATALLQQSSCDVLLTDVYSGYRKAVRETNELRGAEGRAAIQSAYCNSHARRGFKNSEFEAPAEAKFMIDQYKAIYQLEEIVRLKPLDTIQGSRNEMRPHFEAMKAYAENTTDGFSSKSSISQALNYFLKNYDGLTLCLSNPKIPLDNNPTERLLRGPVVGRKTCYGTHSRAGAEVLAIHFSLVEACKLNKINPRSFYTDTIERIHAKKTIMTPREYCASLLVLVPPESS